MNPVDKVLHHVNLKLSKSGHSDWLRPADVFLHTMNSDEREDTSQESFLGPPQYPCSWPRGRQGLKDKHRQRCLLLCWEQRTFLSGRVSLSSKSVKSTRSRCTSWGPRLQDALGENQVVPQCMPQGRLPNGICNRHLRELQPKAFLTPLQCCWIISKPHDWMIHWSPLGSWLSGTDPERTTKFTRGRDPQTGTPTCPKFYSIMLWVSTEWQKPCQVSSSATYTTRDQPKNDRELRLKKKSTWDYKNHTHLPTLITIPKSQKSWNKLLKSGLCILAVNHLQWFVHAWLYKVTAKSATRQFFSLDHFGCTFWHRNNIDAFLGLWINF